MAKEIGLNWLFYLNTGTVASPTWTVITNQRDGNFDISQNTVDTTTKSDSGWVTKVAVTREGAASFSIVYDSTDSTHTALLSAALNGTLKQFKIVGAGGENWIFQAYVGFNIGFPQDNAVEPSITLERYDAPVYAAS